MTTDPWENINEHCRLLDLQGVKDFKLPIIFVLGGPGAGKATLCYQFRAHYGISYISMGSLLRHEADEPTARGREVAKYVHQQPCRKVPVALVVDILKDKLIKVVAACRPVCIQGFPRDFEQAAYYEDEIAPFRHVFYLNASEETSKKRLFQRNKLAARFEDASHMIMRRHEAFRTEVLPIIENLCRTERVEELDGNEDVRTVFKEAQEAFQRWTHCWKKQFPPKPTEPVSRLRYGKPHQRVLTTSEADIEKHFPSVHYHGPSYDSHF